MNSRIREIRKDQRLSMDDFGKVIGISSAAVSKLENGTNKASRQTVTSICREFNVNQEWLLTGNGTKYIDCDDDFKTAAWIVKEFSVEGDTLKKRFLSALSRLSPDQWDMVEQFMLDIIKAKENAPDESPERADHSEVSSTTM